MRDRAALDAWEPALPAFALPHTLPVTVRILEICAGCHSVSRATALEVRSLFGPETQIDVFSVDGKPKTGATREVDILTYDWEHDEELTRFRADGEGVVFYAHASPPCGPYSSMIPSPLRDRDLLWGDSVAQRCLELMAYFRPHYWTLESRPPPGLDSRVFMRTLEPLRATVNYCRYGMNRWKATSIWTNVATWRPEPRCSCRLSNCCDHFREHGRYMDLVQQASRSAPDYAALPEALVRSWTKVAYVRSEGGTRAEEAGDVTESSRGE
jgi:hypothetical protein